MSLMIVKLSKNLKNANLQKELYMNNIVYIYIVIGHRSFFTGKICIVEMDEHHVFIDHYKEPAKIKACKKLGLNKDEVSVLDFKYLGEDVSIIRV